MLLFMHFQKDSVILIYPIRLPNISLDLKKMFRKDNRHKKIGRRTTQGFFKKKPQYIHIREVFDMTEYLAGAGSKYISWSPQRHIVIALPLAEAKIANFQNERNQIYDCSRLKKQL